MTEASGDVADSAKSLKVIQRIAKMP